MTNRVRYYISESDDRAVVRSVPVKVSAQPANELMSIDKRTESPENDASPIRKPVGRIVRVLRKPAQTSTND